MNPVWAQRREDVLRDCFVSPDIFTQMVERLGEFVVPYQHVLATEAGQRNVHVYLVVLKISNVSIPLRFLRFGVYYTDTCDLCLQLENPL